VVAGEPGGCIPATRDRLAAAWGARVIDHYGLSEVGPVAVESPNEPGTMLVLEGDYIAEVINMETGRVIPSGAVGELVLTNLGRWGQPLLRYRTGDLVRGRVGADGRLRLEGGILGRVDDMIQVRGNNVYPAALEAVLRRFADLAEYRVEIDRRGPLAELRITVEPVADADGDDLARRVQQALRDELLFRADVAAAPPASLPRFEMKGQRFVKL
jgi:phenylacetate-CoA ligase